MSGVHQSRSRSGYATVMAMLMLVIGTVFCAWLYTLISNATAIAKNEIDAARAQMAAESGLVYMRSRIGKLTKVHRLKGRNSDEMLEALATELNGKVPGGVSVAHDANGVPFLETGSIALGDNMSFRARFLPSSKNSFDYSLAISGSGGKTATRTLGMEAIQVGKNSVSAMKFPMASKRRITLQSAATNVYRGDTEVKARKPATKGANAADGSDAYVLQWEDDPTDYSGQEIEFPDLPPAAFYDGIDALFIQSPASETSGASQKDTLNVAGGKVIRYSGAGEHLFSDASFTGVIYVKWPGKLTIASATTINGMIIFEPDPDGLPDDAQTTPSYLGLDRDLSFTLNTSNAALKNAMSAAGSWDETQDYATIDWAIIAPNTAFKFDKNQKQQKAINNGSIEIFSAGDNGNWKKPLKIESGSMILEGPYASSGTFDLRITPPEGGGSTGEQNSGYSMDFDSSSYWEQ